MLAVGEESPPLNGVGTLGAPVKLDLIASVSNDQLAACALLVVAKMHLMSETYLYGQLGDRQRVSPSGDLIVEYRRAP